MTGAESIPVLISIHAPRVGSDTWMPCHALIHIQFQSTLPVWGATHSRPPLVNEWLISIHAPRVGSDHMQKGL